MTSSWFDVQAAEEAEARRRAREEIERWAQSPTPPNPRALVEETIQHAEAERQFVSAEEKARLARLADLLALIDTVTQPR